MVGGGLDYFKQLLQTAFWVFLTVDTWNIQWFRPCPVSVSGQGNSSDPYREVTAVPQRECEATSFGESKRRDAVDLLESVRLNTETRIESINLTDHGGREIHTLKWKLLRFYFIFSMQQGIRRTHNSLLFFLSNIWLTCNSKEHEDWIGGWATAINESLKVAANFLK